MCCRGVFWKSIAAGLGFLVLLGERYGWIPERIQAELLVREPWLAQPEFQGASVTELEIQHGVLRWPRPHATPCATSDRAQTML